MVGLAKATQIMTTQDSVELLPGLLKNSTRKIAALAIKGKGDDVEVCEVIWQASDELTMATPSIMLAEKVCRLQLRCGNNEWMLDQSNPVVLIGRDVSCQIVVADRMASRQHARIERRQDKFILVDESTNGSFVSMVGESEVILRRESLMLRGQGRIALGHSVSEAGEDSVAFAVQE
jgi:hypothetical protein